MRVIAVLLLAVASSTMGCSRAHLSPAFGRANQEALSLQVPPVPKPAAPTNMSLDTQEADVIAAAYLRGLAGKAKVDDPEPVLYVAPPPRAQQRVQLAPSVPKD